MVWANCSVSVLSYAITIELHRSAQKMTTDLNKWCQGIKISNYIFKLGIRSVERSIRTIAALYLLRFTLVSYVFYNQCWS